MKGAVVGTGDGNVKMEGGVERDVCGGAGVVILVDPSALPVASNLIC